MNPNNSNNKSKIITKINNTSSKPVKKMILWTRITNSKSTSPHMKQDTNPNISKIKLIKSNYSGQKLKNNSLSKEKSTTSPSSKTKDISNLENNKNYLNNSKITTNQILNSEMTSFQSNSNEENKSSSKLGDSNSKKSDKKPQLFNNIKFKKYININYSLNNNNVNINSSEYHINNTYKYFQSSNGINLRKKNHNKIKNKNNFISDNTNIIINPSKNSLPKKKISKEKIQKNKNILKKSLHINPTPMGNPISPRAKKLLNGPLNSLNKLTSESFNEKKIWNKNAKNSFSERNNEDDLEKIKSLENENKNLKKENAELNKKNKELKILVNKLENEILEIKSVIKDNLNLFLQPEKDFMNKSYKDIIEQIEKEKLNISKIINNHQKTNSSNEKQLKTKEDSNINEPSLIKDRRNDYRIFKKNFFEFFNQVNTSNTLMNGYPTGSDPLKNILNTFCCFMDNVMNKLEEKYIKLDKKENELHNIYINNFSEVCLINIYYQFIIEQLFIVSFYERQHSYYCFSILDYILSSPFMIIKNNNYMKEHTKNINNLIEVYKKINEEYINKFSEQTFFYLDNYIKLFNIIINNRIYLNNNIKLDTDIFIKNTNILFNKDEQKQKVYLDMINDLLEKIKKNNFDLNTERLFEKKIGAKNKVNLIKLNGDNCDLISSLSNTSSKIIDNYSEKPSFYGYLKSEECPPDMSFEDEDM